LIPLPEIGPRNGA